MTSLVSSDDLSGVLPRQVSRGECVLVLGPNGAGKTSLLLAAAGAPASLAQGQRQVRAGASIFHFRQEAADALVGPRTAVEALRASCGAIATSDTSGSDTSVSDTSGSDTSGSDTSGESGDGTAGARDGAPVLEERLYRVMKQLGLPRTVQHTALDDLSGGERARLLIAPHASAHHGAPALFPTGERARLCLAQMLLCPACKCSPRRSRPLPHR
jgi:ATPase subunit of ABC transporter with duplicated ATPase domains